MKAVRENRDPHKICEKYALELNLMTKQEIKVSRSQKNSQFKNGFLLCNVLRCVESLFVGF